MADEDDQLLQDAVARNSTIVLSLPSAAMVRHHKSRFLLAGEAGQFWVESIPQEKVLIEQLLASKQPVSISFIAGTKKIAFSAPILQYQPELQFNAKATLPALLVEKPVGLKAMQRRSDYRVKIYEDSEFSAKAWRISEHVLLRDRPAASAELRVKVNDFSLGGMGVFLMARKEKELLKILDDERVRVELTYKGQDGLVVEGRIRLAGMKPDSPAVRAGIKFKKLEGNLDGRRVHAAMQKILGELQREEIRRQKLAKSA